MPAIETVYAGGLSHVELAIWVGACRLRFHPHDVPAPKIPASPGGRRGGMT